ncbi:hypothetical protein ACI3PL_25935, partial [Lacticaseibacillus paracasei]
GKPIPCQQGFHFCEYPLDVLSYYSPNNARFAEVEGEGCVKEQNSDSKVACSTLHIKGELSIAGLVKAAIDYTFSKAKKPTKKGTA